MKKLRNVCGLKTAAGLLIALLNLTPYAGSVYAGNFADVYGAHPYAAGMGGAVTAFINDSSAVFYNVAGLGAVSRSERLIGIAQNKNGNMQTADTSAPWWQRPFEGALSKEPLVRPESGYSHELMLMYNYAKPRLKTNAPNNQDIENIKDHNAGLGVTLNLSEIYDTGRNIRFGLELQTPATGNLATINDLNPTVHRYLQHGVSNERPVITGGLGVELWKDHLFIGVGFTMLLKGQGAILLKDVPVSPDTVTPDQQIILELRPLVNPTYGLMFHYGRFRAGVSYRRETYLSVDALNARAQTTLLGIQLDFDLAILDLHMPRTWSFGIAYDLFDNWTISIDANRELWSRIRPSRTKDKYSEDFYFNDITAVRAGLEYRWLSWLSVRVGVAKRPTPLPEMPGRNNWMDFDRMIYSLGASLYLIPDYPLKDGGLRNPVTLDLVLQNQQYKPVEVWKYNPTQSNPFYSYGGNAWYGGLAVTFTL